MEGETVQEQLQPPLAIPTTTSPSFATGSDVAAGNMSAVANEPVAAKGVEEQAELLEQKGAADAMPMDSFAASAPFALADENHNAWNDDSMHVDGDATVGGENVFTLRLPRPLDHAATSDPFPPMLDAHASNEHFLDARLDEDGDGVIDDDEDIGLLNEVEDAPREFIQIGEDDEEAISEEEEPLAPALEHVLDAKPIMAAVTTEEEEEADSRRKDAKSIEESSSELDEDEVVDRSAQYCYCREGWSGEELMVCCDRCQQWYHADCMGIPKDSNIAEETFKCDGCLAEEGLPPNQFPLPRRDRAAERAAAAAAAGKPVTAARAKKKSSTAATSPHKAAAVTPAVRSQRIRKRKEKNDELLSEIATKATKRSVEAAQKKAKERAAKRAQREADKAAGLSKAARAAKRAKERQQRRAEREAAKLKAEKDAQAAGLKSLLASFDDSDSDYTSSSSSDESSSSSSDSSSSDSDDSEAVGASKSHAAATKSVAPSAGKAVPAASAKPSASTPTNAAKGAAAPAAKGKAVPPSPSTKTSAVTAPTKPTPTATTTTGTNVNYRQAAVQAMQEPIRSKVRESLTPLLGADLASAVETAFFALEHKVGPAYKSQYREVIANLKDTNNDLKQRVQSGAISPSALSRMTVKELASSELASFREALAKEAVKMAVRPPSPPRLKKMQVMYGESTLEDYSLPSEKIVSLVTGIQPKVEEEVGGEAKKTSVASKPAASPATNGQSVPTASSTPTSVSLASLPDLPTFDEVVASIRGPAPLPNNKKPSSNSAATSSSSSSSSSSELRRQKRQAIAAAANAELAREKMKARLEKAKARASATTISDSDEEVEPGEARAPRAERIQVKKSSANGDAEEVSYQKLGLPPMDVWSGDLLLAAGSNPSVLTNFFPLAARQIGGPPILTLPLPSRLEEKLRIDLSAVESYLTQLLASGTSKRVVVVEVDLNIPPSSSSARDKTLQQDFDDFCRSYKSKKRALAFDFQKDADASNRLLFYLIPPDTTTGALSVEWVRKHLQLERPAGKMWGVVLLPRETYLPIAKRISKLMLEKMRAQYAAVKAVNQLHPPPSTTGTGNTPSPPPTGSVRPQDPRRPAATAQQPEKDGGKKDEAMSGDSSTAGVADASSAQSASNDGSAALAAVNALAASMAHKPAAAPSPAAAPTSDAGGSILSSLLSSGGASLDVFSSYLSQLVGKATGASSTAATTSTAGSAAAPAASVPVPTPVTAPALASSLAPTAAFPPPPPAHLAAAFPPPPPPVHQQPYQAPFPPPRPPMNVPYQPPHVVQQPPPPPPPSVQQVPYPVPAGPAQHQPPPHAFPPPPPQPSAGAPSFPYPPPPQQQQHGQQAQPPHRPPPAGVPYVPPQGPPAPPPGPAAYPGPMHPPHPQPPAPHAHMQPRPHGPPPQHQVQQPQQQQPHWQQPLPAQPPAAAAPPPPHAPPFDDRKRPRSEFEHPSVEQPPARKSRFGPKLAEPTVAPSPPQTQQLISVPSAAVGSIGGVIITPGGPIPSLSTEVATACGVCRFFFSAKGCVKDNCQYSHDPRRLNAAALGQIKALGMHVPAVQQMLAQQQQQQQQHQHHQQQQQQLQQQPRSQYHHQPVHTQGPAQHAPVNMPYAPPQQQQQQHSHHFPPPPPQPVHGGPHSFPPPPPTQQQPQPHGSYPHPPPPPPHAGPPRPYAPPPQVQGPPQHMSFPPPHHMQQPGHPMQHPQPPPQHQHPHPPPQQQPYRPPPQQQHGAGRPYP